MWDNSWKTRIIWNKLCRTDLAGQLIKHDHQIMSQRINSKSLCTKLESKSFVIIPGLKSLLTSEIRNPSYEKFKSKKMILSCDYEPSRFPKTKRPGRVHHTSTIKPKPQFLHVQAQSSVRCHSEQLCLLKLLHLLQPVARHVPVMPMLIRDGHPWYGLDVKRIVIHILLHFFSTRTNTGSRACCTRTAHPLSRLGCTQLDLRRAGNRVPKGRGTREGTGIQLSGRKELLRFDPRIWNARWDHLETGTVFFPSRTSPAWWSISTWGGGCSGSFCKAREPSRRAGRWRLRLWSQRHLARGNFWYWGTGWAGWSFWSGCHSQCQCLCSSQTPSARRS